MGANPTQAQAVCLFFDRICADRGRSGRELSAISLLILGLLALRLVGMLFLKCKPWEHNEE